MATVTDAQVEAARRVAPPDVHEALGLVAYHGHGAGRDHRPPMVRVPADWFDVTIDDLQQPNGPITPSNGLGASWTT